MIDFTLNTNNDLDMSTGDFAIANTELQHQEHILIAQKGEYKAHPEIGVGIVNALNSENPRQVMTQIKRNFEYDGMRVNTLKVLANGNLDIDAVYKTS